MKNTINNAVRRMLIQVFRPLVRIMLRLNVPYHEVTEVLKWTYVDVADQHFGINGKRPTKSRISVITGLSRTQVDMQTKKDLFDDEEQPNKWHRAVRVLTGWVEDQDFLDPHGKARLIPLESDDEPDFKTLVDRYSGGSTYRSIMDDLLLSGSIKVKNGEVELLKPYYLTENDDDDIQKIDFLGVSTQYLLETIDHNIDPNRPGPKFQRIVYHEGLPSGLYNIAESFVRSKCQSLANEVDEYLAHLIQHADKSQQQDLIPYIGVGLYFYNGDSTTGQQSILTEQLTGAQS